jgi:hypothetical protein
MQLVGGDADHRIAAPTSSGRPNGSAGDGVHGVARDACAVSSGNGAGDVANGAGSGNAGREAFPDGGEAARGARRRRRSPAASFLGDPLRVVGQRLGDV